MCMWPDKDNAESPHEECLSCLDEDGEEFDWSSERQQANQGPPESRDDEVVQLDHETSLEELVRLGNMGVISYQ